MSTLSLPLSQPREVTRRRLSLRRVEVAPQSRRDTAAAPSGASSTASSTASSALESVKSAVAALPARLEALMRQTPASHTDTPAVPLEAIMQGATTLPILHNGDVYTLRVTRYGKLILTK
ncbi:hemin uptake protein HemP [Cupriavidus sp. CER94]|uniref:hemin uptake protein HemP n=1 Tax=Cupriavidus sp. CER94 TaxID=3377036 RepID=UPI00380C131B